MENTRVYVDRNDIEVIAKWCQDMLGLDDQETAGTGEVNRSVNFCLTDATTIIYNPMRRKLTKDISSS